MRSPVTPVDDRQRREQCRPFSADASQTPVSTGTTPICASHATAATVSVSHQPAPVCLVTGTRLTVTFDKTHAAIGTPGPWGVPRVQVQPRILTIRSTVAKGPLLTAHLVARTRGIAIVRAGFNQECSIGDTTPCTIPPQAILTLDVTVVPKRH
jgi:hypothetical protein